MTYHECSDDELVEIYRRTGDKGAVFELYRRISHHLSAMVMKILRNREETEDILSDVLVDLFDDLKKDVVIKNIGGFIYIKTRNRCLSYLKKRDRINDQELTEQNFPEDLVENQDLSSLDEKPIEAVKQILEECIKALPEKEKTCLRLFYLHERGDGNFGLSYKEVAQRTGLSLREITSALQTARRRVKKCLQSRGIDDGTNLFEE